MFCREQKHKYAHSITDDYTESEREDSARSGNSGSRGSNPLSEEDDHLTHLQHTQTNLNLLIENQQGTSTSITANLCSTDHQLSLNTAASGTTNVYNNFNFAPHFENYWATGSSAPTAANPFSAAQMCYPFGMYSYANYPTYPAMYPSASYIKFMNGDSSATLSAPTNSIPNQQNNENYQFGVGQNAKYTASVTKYEPPNNDYQSL